MPSSPFQQSITVGGKTFLWTRTPTTQSVELFMDLAPAIIPAIMDVATLLPVEWTREKGVTMIPFQARDLAPLPETMRKALKELPFPRLMDIARKALRNTTIGNIPVLGERGEGLDIHLDSAAHFFELLFRVLSLQYGDFSAVLEGLGLRLRGQGASPSEESTTSAGPSSA